MKYFEDWVFNILNMNNYKTENWKKYYYDNIIETLESVEGDIVEVGVYKGKSILSTALPLKEYDSDKIVYGFDSFTGFPPKYSKYDSIEYFDELRVNGTIDDLHYKRIQYFHKILTLSGRKTISPETSSSSQNFSD